MTDLPPLKPSVDPSGVEKGVGRVVQSLETMKKSWVDMAGQAAALAGVGLSLHKIVEEAGSAEKGMIRLQALLRAQGIEAQKTSQAVANLAEKMQKSTTFDDDAFVNASTGLIRMGVASGETLERLLKLSAGLASASDRFGGVEQASLALGRALKTPGESMRMLEMAGFGVSKSVLESAKSLAEGGKQAEAMSLIMGELEKKVGDTAEKMAHSLPGSIERTAAAFANMAEAIGRDDSARNSIITFFDTLREKIEGSDGIIKGVASALTFLFDGLTAALTPVFDALNGVWSLADKIVAGFQAIPEAIAHTMGTTTESVMEMMGTAYDGVKEYVSGIMDFFLRLADRMLLGFARMFDFLGRQFAVLINSVSSAFASFGIGSATNLDESGHTAEVFYNNWKKSITALEASKNTIKDTSGNLSQLKLNLGGAAGAAGDAAQKMEKLREVMEKGDALRNRNKELEREIFSMKQGKAAYDEYKAAVKATNDIKEYEKSLHKVQAEGYKITNAEIKELVANYTALRPQLDAATEAMQRQEEEAKKMQAIYDNAAEGIRGSFKEAFLNIFNDGTNTFGSLFSNIMSAWKNMAAEIISTRLFSAGSGDIFSALSGGKSSGGGGLGSLLGKGGGISSIFDNLFGGSSLGITAGVKDPVFGYMGQLGAQGSGGIASGGGFFSNIFGSGGGFGGSIFGAGGTSLGTVFGNSGYGFIGSTAANLFGLGGGVGGQIGGTAGSLIGSAVGGPIGAIAGSFLGSALGGLFGGDDGRRQRDLEAARKTNEWDAAIQQLNKQLRDAGNESTNFSKQVQAIKDQFSQTRAQIAQYGGSMETVNQLEAAAIAKLKAAFQDNIDQQIAALTNDAQYQLDALKKAQDARYREAIDAEADMSKVIKLNQLELQKFYDSLTLKQKEALGGLIDAVEVLKSKIADLGTQINTAIDKQMSLVEQGLGEAKALAEAYKAVAKTLKDTVASLREGSLSTLSPKDALDEMRSRFTGLVTSASGGDIVSLQALPGLATSLLQASKNYNASSTGYASDFAYVEEALNRLGITATSFGGAQDYRVTLMEEQKKLLEAIKENLAKESPDAPLLKEQLAALGVVGDLIRDTNSLSASQADLLKSSNAIQDTLTKLSEQGVSASTALRDVIMATSNSQVNVSSQIVTGTYSMVAMLQNYISYLQQKDAAAAAKAAADAAAAARAAKIGAAIQEAGAAGSSLQNALAGVVDATATENQHSWVVRASPVSGGLTASFTGDKGSAEWDRPRAEAAAAAINNAIHQVVSRIGITSGVGDFQYEIATKYGSNMWTPLGQYSTSINDYEGMAANGILSALKLGSGGNQQLKDYAKSLNWYDLTGALKSLEQKAIDLGLRGFADGSPYVSSGYAIVGERGPEVVKFNGGESIYPASQSLGMLSGANGELAGLLRIIDGRLAASSERQSKDIDALRQEMVSLNSSLRKASSLQSAGSFGGRVA